MSDIREILLKEGTGYTRNKKITRTENAIEKNSTNGNGQLSQSPKNNLTNNEKA